jgi:hypothetical protein
MTIKHLIGIIVISSGVARAQAPAEGKAPAPAHADIKETTEDRPWAKSVSPETQRAALALFRDGNVLLKESLFVQAAAKYREALAKWDHPAIHYNLALALLNLDQPVEVWSQLEEAMKFGAAPLDADKFEHATRYKALIERQVARVEITCKEAGALVSFDGRTVFTGPGKYNGMVRVGQHTVVAAKQGYVTTQKTPTLLSGEKTAIDLAMFTAEDLTLYKRNWAVWIPFSVLAAGVVVAGVGGILQWQAAESFKAFDAGIQACGGCAPDASLDGKLGAGNGLQATAFVAYTLGALVIAGGAVLATLNRARPYRINPERESKVSFAPWAGPQGGGIVGLLAY